MTDQFATVTVVPNEEIRRAGTAQLGDLLFSKPGITGSTFAPGASSRPVIRGLDVNRVGIVENGSNAGGASDLGEDHFVPIDPLATNQVEVIRGPAALRYGSTSIGGVVSATNNRIPDALPSCAAAPFQTYGLPAPAPLASVETAPCVAVETRTAVNSVDRGVDGGILLDTGGGNFAFHADAFGRKASDYSIPSYPYLFDPTKPFNGRQPNSAMQADGASIGGSYIFQGGFIGAAITQNDTLYRIPGIDGADHQTRIDGHQTKFTAKAEYRPDAAAIDAVRLWAGATDYHHNEIGLADPVDPSTVGVRQTFTNKEQEGRLELQMMPFNARFATVTTAFGLQAGHQQLTAPSPDDPGSPINGLWDPNSNNRVASYVFNEFKFTETTKAQIAGRIERVNLSGTTPAFIPDVFNVNVDPDSIGPATPRNPHFTPKSASFGLIQNLPWDLVASVTGAICRTRAQTGRAVFARPARCDRHLRHRQSQSRHRDRQIDRGRVAAGDRAVAIRSHRLLHPVQRLHLPPAHRQYCDEFGLRRCGHPARELKQAVYSQRDAIFRGGEFQSQLDVAPLMAASGASRTSSTSCAPPSPTAPTCRAFRRYGSAAACIWRDANWLVRINLLHAFAQNDIAPIGETPTAGYNLLKAEISYKTKLDPSWFGAREMTVGLVGNNLLNENIRNSVSLHQGRGADAGHRHARVCEREVLAA